MRLFPFPLPAGCEPDHEDRGEYERGEPGVPEHPEETLPALGEGHLEVCRQHAASVEVPYYLPIGRKHDERARVVEALVRPGELIPRRFRYRVDGVRLAYKEPPGGLRYRAAGGHQEIPFLVGGVLRRVPLIEAHGNGSKVPAGDRVHPAEGIGQVREIGIADVFAPEIGEREDDRPVDEASERNGPACLVKKGPVNGKHPAWSFGYARRRESTNGKKEESQEEKPSPGYAFWLRHGFPGIR